MMLLILAIISSLNTKPLYDFYVDYFIHNTDLSAVSNNSASKHYLIAKKYMMAGDFEKALYNFYYVTLGDNNNFSDSALYFISLIQDKLGLYNEAMDSRKYFLERFSNSPLIGKIEFLYALNLRNLTRNFQDAIYYLEKARESGDSVILRFTYVESGITFFMMRNFLKAKDHLERAEDFTFDEPVNSYYRCILGFDYIELGRIQYARKLLESCFNPALENYRLLYLAKLYMQIGYPDSAKNFLKKILRRSKVEDDVLGSAYYLLGELSFIEGEYKKSMKFYKIALDHYTIDIDPDRLRYKIELCKYKLGYYKSPTELNINFVKKYPDSPIAPELLYEVFFLYTVKHWFKSALNVLEWLASRYDGNAYTIQAISEGLKHGIKAKNIYKIVIPHIPSSYLRKNPAASLVIAALYDSLGMSDSALALYSQIINSGNNTLKYQAMLQSMNIYFKIKRYNEAIALGHRLYRVAPDGESKFQVVMKLKEAYTNSGQLKDLESFLLNAIKDFKGNRKAQIYMQLAELREQFGDIYMAKIYLKKAFETASSETMKRRISRMLSKYP